jgi:competence protein ComEA
MREEHEMTRLVRWLNAGPLGALLRSRYYVPVASALLVVVVAATGGLALVRAGVISLSLAGSHSDISITGPGASGDSGLIQAYVLGAIVSPGVYALPPEARIHDLVTAAGGATRDADLTRVSMAGPLHDGQSVYVPHSGETIPALLGGKINLNTASETDLHNGLNLSKDLSKRVVTYRTTHGPFTAVSQLLLVPLSRTTYDRIKDLVIV